MGANTSSAGGAGAGTGQRGRPQAALPEDHYEVLGISVEATGTEIKKAYRSQALIHHPDKNPNDIQGSTIRFAKIQSAYEVLSDDQERAWYNQNRDRINPGGGGADTAADEAYFDSMRRGAAPKPRAHGRGLTPEQLMRFFTTAAWTGFDDSPTGFYTTFRTLFALIAAEEAALNSPLEYPAFGTAQSAYVSTPSRPTDVRNFYGAWLNFSTEKDFNWRDQYRPEEGMDRRMKRMIEKENVRERGQGRREYNECIRNLVLYVRRRDPRYTMSQSSLSPEAFRAAESARLKADLLLAAKERAKEKEAQAQAYRASAPEWQRHGEEGSGTEEDSDEEDDEEQWCVACSKGFRSGGAWENHERSRKHLKNLEKLVLEMHLEDEELDLSNQADPHEPSPPPTASSSRAVSPTPSETLSAHSTSPPPPTEQESLVKDLARGLSDFKVAHPENDDEPAAARAAGPGKKSRGTKGKKAKAGPQERFGVEAQEQRAEDEVFEAVGKVKKSRRAKGKGKASGTGTPVPEGGEVGEEREEGTSTPVSKASTPVPKASTPIPKAGSQKEKEGDESDDGLGAEMSKKDRRRAKEAAKKLESEAGLNLNDDLRCNACSTSFPSRTKLFNHIKETGHAEAEAVDSGPSGKGGKRRGKR